jgi:putative ABC transport system permease protein
LKGLRLTSTGGAALIRKGLVILQFSVSVILIISTTIIYQQIQLAKDRDLGYKKEGLLTIRLKGKMKEHFTAIRNDLLQTGVVRNASLSTNVVLQMGSNSGGFVWEGKDPGKDVLITVESVSPEYISTMGMQLKEGRDFYAQAEVDSNNIIINETLAKIINPKKNVVGKVLEYGQSKYTVVGVVKDFVYNNMYSSGAPLVFFSDLSNTQVMTLRIKADAGLPAALAKIEHLVKQHNPGYPFEYRFVDDTFNTLFTTETLIGKLAGVFAALAILISCLGLFGLAAYTAERRTKEIAIRKTIGAGILRIAELLSGDFVRLVALSCIIAFPVSWWMMHNWLQSFEYRIRIHWWIFVLAGVVAILIALLTVSFQVLKAAVANPVKGLRAQ